MLLLIDCKDFMESKQQKRAETNHSRTIDVEQSTTLLSNGNTQTESEVGFATKFVGS